MLGVIWLPGGASGKEPICQCRRHKRHGFDPWVGRRAWQPIPVLLPGESHGQRSLVGYSPWGWMPLRDFNFSSSLSRIKEYFSQRSKACIPKKSFHMQMRQLKSGWEKLNYLRITEVGFQVSGSVQLLSHIWLFLTPWAAARQASLSNTSSQSPPKLMSIESVMPPNHLILCRPLLLLPSILPSIRVFSNESAVHIRWPKYWSFRFNIRPSNEYPGLISFRMDWLDLLAVQGTLKSLLQHHSSIS